MKKTRSGKMESQERKEQKNMLHKWLWHIRADAVNNEARVEKLCTIFFSVCLCVAADIYDTRNWNFVLKRQKSE